MLDLLKLCLSSCLPFLVPVLIVVEEVKPNPIVEDTIVVLQEVDKLSVS